MNVDAMLELLWKKPNLTDEEFILKQRLVEVITASIQLETKKLEIRSRLIDDGLYMIHNNELILAPFMPQEAKDFLKEFEDDVS